MFIIRGKVRGFGKSWAKWDNGKVTASDEVLERFLINTIEAESIVDLPGVMLAKPPHINNELACSLIMKFWFQGRKIENDPLELPEGAVG